MAKITPFLWYDNQAEEATNFYTSIFKNSKPGSITRLRAAPPGSNDVKSVTFKLEGQHFMVLNGGPAHKFTPAVSLFVDRETQDREGRVVALTERTRQHWPLRVAVRPIRLFGADHSKGTWRDAVRSLSQRVLKAMLQMSEIDLGGLKRAYANE